MTLTEARTIMDDTGAAAPVKGHGIPVIKLDISPLEFPIKKSGWVDTGDNLLSVRSFVRS